MIFLISISVSIFKQPLNTNLWAEAFGVGGLARSCRLSLSESILPEGRELTGDHQVQSGVEWGQKSLNTGQQSREVGV